VPPQIAPSLWPLGHEGAVISALVGGRASPPVLRASFFVFRVKVCRGGAQVAMAEFFLLLRLWDGSALSQKVSSLENQMSALMAKIAHLEECDLYMTEIIEAASEQLSCKLLGAP
jgi:hypothetical protein